MEVKIAPPSAAQMKKMHMGHPFRATMDPNGMKVHVPIAEAKKLAKAHMKGMSATLHGCSCCGCGLCGDGYFKPRATLNWAGARKSGTTSGGSGNNFVSTAKDSGKRLMVSGTDRTVRAIEGSGVFNQAKKMGESKAKKALHGGAGKNFVSTAKDSGKRLMVSGTDRTVRAIEGSGVNAPGVHTGSDGRALTGWVHSRVQANRPSSEGGKINRLKKFNKWFKSIGQKTKTLNHNLKPIKEAATNRAADYITYYDNPQAQAQAGIDMFQKEAGQTGRLFTKGKKHGHSFGSVPYYPAPAGLSGTFISPPSAPPMPPQPIDVNEDGQPDGYFYPNEASWFGAGMKKRGKGVVPRGQIALLRQVYAGPPTGTGATRFMHDLIGTPMTHGGAAHFGGPARQGSPVQGQPPAGAQPIPARQVYTYMQPNGQEYMGYRPPPNQRGGMIKNTDGHRFTYSNTIGAGKKSKKTSPWIAHVKQYAAEHGMKYGEALKAAKSTYKSEEKEEKVEHQKLKKLKGSHAKKTSPWITHVKKYAAEHGMKYSEALKAAKATYKTGGTKIMHCECTGGSMYPAGYDPRFDYY